MHKRIFLPVAALLCAVALLAAPASAQQRAVGNPTIIPHIVDLPVDRSAPTGWVEGGGCTGSEDIVQAVSNSAVGLAVGFNEALGQSFNAPCTGAVDAITVSVANLLTAGSANFTLHAGLGDGGTVLNAQTVSFSAIGPVTVTLSPAVAITQGQDYTFKFAVSGTNPLVVDFEEASTNPYAGGTEYNIAFGGGGTFFGADPQYDLVFTADVEPAGGTQCSLSLSGADISPNSVAAGGTVTFSGSVVQAGPGQKAISLRANYDGPGSLNGSLNLGAASNVPPGTYPFSRPVRVPANAPSGSYVVTLQVINSGTGEVCDDYTETITVTAPRLGEGTGTELFEAAPSGDLFGASATTTSSAVSPNPFARQTQIAYTVAATANVRLSVYDVLGREVAVLVDGTVEAGQHAATFDARGLAAGTYVYRLSVGNDVQTGRMTLAH